MLDRLLSENFVKILLFVSELQVKIPESSVPYETLDIVKGNFPSTTRHAEIVRTRVAWKLVQYKLSTKTDRVTTTV